MFASFGLCAMAAKAKLRSFLSKENGEVNIVAIVVLCGIAVILALVFKDGIKRILEGLFGTIEKNANEAIQKNG